MVALDVLERFAKQLRDYTIVLFSVGERPRERAIELANAGVLNIKVIDWAPHEEILRQFGLARLYLGISISDAISTSVPGGDGDGCLSDPDRYVLLCRMVHPREVGISPCRWIISTSSATGLNEP